MSPNGVTELCITLRDDPDSIVLVNDGVLRIRIAEGVCLYFGSDSAPVLRALAGAADQAAELLDQAAIVALNTPGLPADPIHATYPERGAA